MKPSLPIFQIQGGWMSLVQFLAQFIAMSKRTIYKVLIIKWMEPAFGMSINYMFSYETIFLLRSLTSKEFIIFRPNVSQSKSHKIGRHFRNLDRRILMT